MSAKPPSVHPEQPDASRTGAAPADDVEGDDSEVALPEAKPAGESYDDSLEAILLQAGARPPETAASKLLGSKTLMGMSLEGLNLAALRPDAAAKAPSAPGGGRSGNAAAAEIRLPPGLPSGDKDKPATSLLDEVAEALNVQASEYRDRARGRLPGMPGAGKATGPSFKAKGESGLAEAEFEDPDDGDTALTPGVISVMDTHDGDGDIDLDAETKVGVGDDEDAVVLAPVGLPGSAKTRDSRPMPVPPPPGLALAASTAPVGPPPGVPGRPPTPPAGLPPTGSGRVRLPTPLAGHATARPLPPPPSGRLTLPIGTMAPSLTPSIVDLTATAPSTPISLEASRRITAGLSVPGSGRVSSRGSARVTEPVIHTRSQGLVISGLPVVLAAQVKIATLSLAGLIALTFAGGLFVGMLVWRGQTRPETLATGTRTAPTVAPATVAAPAAEPSAAAPGPVADPTAAAGSGTAQATTATVPTTEAVAAPGAPTAAEPAESAAKQPVRRPVAALRTPPRPHRATTPTSTSADPAAIAAPKPVAAKPIARPPAPSASKPVAANGDAKPAAKSKAKAAWHDPFAD